MCFDVLILFSAVERYDASHGCGNELHARKIFFSILLAYLTHTMTFTAILSTMRSGGFQLCRRCNGECGAGFRRRGSARSFQATPRRCLFSRQGVWHSDAAVTAEGICRCVRMAGGLDNGWDLRLNRTAGFSCGKNEPLCRSRAKEIPRPI